MTAPDTLVHRIKDWAATTPDRPATHGCRDGVWRTRTWAQHWRAIDGLGRGLIALGQPAGGGVAIVGNNCPQWVESQFAIQAIGAIPVPLYPASTLAEFGYIVRDAGVQIAFCDGQGQVERLLAAEREGHMPPLKHIVVFEPVASNDPRILSLDHLRGTGLAQAPDALEQRLAALTSDGTCMLIYTSGTTGEPKGVRINPAGQLAACQGMLERFPTFRTRPYRVVSYLPLSHQAEQLVTNVGAIQTGGEVYFCPQISEVKDYLLKARPTLFLAVPRVWEKFEAALRSRLAEQTGLGKWLTDRACSVELAGFDRDRQDGRYHGGFERNLLRRLVLDKVRAGLGLDCLDVAVTGSAPIDGRTLRFFGSLGIPIYEAYGLTETSGLVSTTTYGRPNPGSVGPALPGVEIKLADDGEVLIRGAVNTAGYHNLPEASAALFSADGYLQTGDLGTLAADGSLSITGRKKEILITAGAKNIAPVEIENLLNRIVGVGQSMVVGDRMPYLAALVTLDPEQRAALLAAVGMEGSASVDMAGLARSPAVHGYLWDRVQRDCNAHLARYKTIKKIAVVPGEFSVEARELTASMKLRRSVIADRHRAQIDAMYSREFDGASVVAAAE